MIQPKFPCCIFNRFTHLLQSDGVRETYLLASKYTSTAIKDISIFNDSQEKNALRKLCQYVLDRNR